MERNYLTVALHICTYTYTESHSITATKVLSVARVNWITVFVPHNTVDRKPRNTALATGRRRHASAAVARPSSASRWRRRPHSTVVTPRPSAERAVAWSRSSAAPRPCSSRPAGAASWRCCWTERTRRSRPPREPARSATLLRQPS